MPAFMPAAQTVDGLDRPDVPTSTDPCPAAVCATSIPTEAAPDRRTDCDSADALRYVEACVQAAATIPDLPPVTRARDVRRVGVIGSGTMGGGIAMAFANAGFDVVLLDVDAAALDRGLAVIRANYATSVAKGRLAPADRDAALARIRGTTGYDDLGRVDLAIEAVYEDLALKEQVFARLDGACRPGAILATNTSTLDVDAIARATRRPRDVLGLHFFSPAHVMRLLEIVRGAATAPDVLATALALAGRLRKVGVVSGVCDGFIGNRMVAGYVREASYLVLEGAAPQQVDRVLCEFGFRMGPIAMGDMVGLDVSVKAADEAVKAGRGPGDPRDLRLARRLVAAGRLGQKTGAGVYRYAPGDRRPQPDGEVDRLIEGEAAALGIRRREIDDDEIVRRCVYPLIDEAARILEEGIALRPGDVDAVWVHGYGFPPARGGPLYYADQIGAAEVHRTTIEFRELHGARWSPAPLLSQLAAHGGRFRDLPPRLPTASAGERTDA
jgi:3-hydroxyacyl-CoA dehydrogenase